VRLLIFKVVFTNFVAWLIEAPGCSLSVGRAVSLTLSVPINLNRFCSKNQFKNNNLLEKIDFLKKVTASLGRLQQMIQGLIQSGI
jgi:hypothetical protein